MTFLRRVLRFLWKSFVLCTAAYLARAQLSGGLQGTLRTTADNPAPDIATGMVLIGNPPVSFELDTVMVSSLSFPNATIPNFLIITPQSGTTPANVRFALNPSIAPYMPSGIYNVQVNFKPIPPATGVASALITAILSDPGLPMITSVVNSASLLPAISPGELVTILGTNLSTPPVSGQLDSTGSYPTLLGNSIVTFNGIPAPLLYASNGQINAIVPCGLAGQKTVNVVVIHPAFMPDTNGTNPGFSSAPLSIPVADTAPGIFTVSQSGSGQGAIFNAIPETGTLFQPIAPNNSSNPAPAGSAINILATGAGVLNNPPPQDGSILLFVGYSEKDFAPAAPVSLTIGGQPTTVQVAGTVHYGVFGVIEISAIIPAGLASGPQPVVLTVGQNSNSQQRVTVAVQ